MSNPPAPRPPWIERILTRQLDPELRRDACRRMRERRRNKPDVVQFVEIDDSYDKAVPVVPDQLLVRTADLRRDRSEVLRAHDLKPEPVAELDGRVQRITLPPDRKGKLAETHALLRRHDVPVEPTAIVPMGGDPVPDVVWKSLCTPEPAVVPFHTAPEVGTRAPLIVVLDTGVTDEERADKWLKGLAHGDNVDPLDVFPVPNGFLDLAAGHGTFVAGIIQRVVPTAQLDVRRVLDSDGLADETTVASAMVAAARGGADIINLSLGTETFDDQPPVALSVAMEIIKEIEQDQGREIVVVAAAGNSPNARAVYPAALPDVIAVAALTPTRQPAAWSTRGPWVDCSAVGENVVSTYVAGKEDGYVRYGDPVPPDPPDEYGPNSWARWSGTSFAAPLVTGRIAQLAQAQDLTVRGALATLREGPQVNAAFGVLVE